MSQVTLTPDQIDELMFSDPYSLIFRDLIIGYHPQTDFEIYTLDAADDSDPNPIFTGTAQEIITYFENL